MDGPTARIAEQKGRPSARDIAPAMTGPRSTHVSRYAVAFGLMRLGLLSPDNGLAGQTEGANAFTAADLGSDTASAYCARESHRIPVEDTAENFSFSAAASLRIQQTIKDSPSMVPQLRRSRTSAMLMIAECSSQVRQWQTTILANTAPSSAPRTCPASATTCGTAWVTTTNEQPPPSPRSSKTSPHRCPTRADVPAFLRGHK